MKDIELVKKVLGKTLTVGDAPRSGALTLVAIHGGTASPSYMTAGDAFKAGTLKVTEVGEGSVPEIFVDNQGSLPVLFIDGEQLEGAKQDRVLNTSILVAAGTKTTVPVSCVEAGRWRYEGGSEFDLSADRAFSKLRGRNKAEIAHSLEMGMGRRVSQSRVWAGVDAMNADMAAESPTGAMRDSFKGQRDRLDRVIEDFAKPAEGQTGVAAFVGAELVALEVFDKPAILAAVWPRLVSGYALDSLAGESAAGQIGLKAVAEQKIREAGFAKANAHDAIGLGTDVVITTDDLVGDALVWKDGVVHTTLFPSSENSGSEGEPIRRSRRGPLPRVAREAE